MVNIISDPAFLTAVEQKGQYFREQLVKLTQKHKRAIGVRGKGLLVGLEVDTDATYFVAELMKKGFIINGIQDKILRFAPPLIIEKNEIDRLIEALDSLL